MGLVRSSVVIHSYIPNCTYLVGGLPLITSNPLHIQRNFHILDLESGRLHAPTSTVPPTLRALPHNGQVTARKGSTVTLECKASGNPVPTIYWYKKDVFSGTTHLSDSSTLILDNVDRHHAGIYQCSADNGVKERVSMDIQLTILCKCSLVCMKISPGLI